MNPRINSKVMALRGLAKLLSLGFYEGCFFRRTRYLSSQLSSADCPPQFRWKALNYQLSFTEKEAIRPDPKTETPTLPGSPACTNQCFNLLAPIVCNLLL